MMIAFVMQAWESVERLNKFLNSEQINPDNVTNKPSENALSIADGWGGERRTLRNINLSVKKGNLTAIVGSDSCGKTSIISAFLGEMEKSEGKVNVDGRVAYVSQQAWIQSATLKDNILFGKAFDQQKYDRAIHVR